MVDQSGTVDKPPAGPERALSSPSPLSIWRAMMPESAVELGYPEEAEVTGIEGIASVPAAFQRTASVFADAVAYRTIDDSIRLTWAEVATQVERWSRALA